MLDNETLNPNPKRAPPRPATLAPQALGAAVGPRARGAELEPSAGAVRPRR